MKREIKVLTEAERRKLDGKRVSLHFKLTNPHKGMFVVKVLPDTKVLGYLDRAVLEDCTVRIHHSARRKVADGANRSVHAWILGTFRYRETSGEYFHNNEIHYNPKRDQSFVLHNGGAVETAKAILFYNKHIYLLKG